MRFTIPGELPTTNEIIAASKRHHMQYATMKKEFTWLVAMSAKGLRKVKKADFVITWICKDRRKDKDNITGGQKFIFDGLVNAGILENDGWNQIGNVSHVFAVDKENPRIEVEIKEIGNEDKRTG